MDVIKGLLVLILAGVLAACQSSKDAAPGPPGASTQESGRTSSRFKDVEIPPAVLKAILPDTPEQQLQLLKDGRLTFAEYESAVLTMSACVQRSDLGIRFAQPTEDGTVEVTAGPFLNVRGRYEYGFVYYGPISESERVIRECRDSELTMVENVWIESVAPAQADYDKARVALAQCMKDRGEPVQGDDLRVSFTEYRLHPTPAYWQCCWRIQKDFGLPGFSG